MVDQRLGQLDYFDTSGNFDLNAGAPPSGGIDVLAPGTVGAPAPYSPSLAPIEPVSTPSSPLYDVFGTVGGPSTTTPLQSVNWGNGVTGTYDKLSNTFYDSNGNPLSGAELQQYGAFTLGGPASSTAGIASIGSGIASAISKIFSPSPSAGVPPRPGVATASISPSLGSSLSSLLLPIAAIAAIALVVKRR